MKSKVDSAIEIFGKGFNCSQAVFGSHCEDLGLPVETARKIACAFGGGMGLSGGTCGAVTGALMLIGLKYGKYLETDNEAKDKTYKLRNRFMELFTKEMGSVDCTKLLKYDLSKPDEYQKAREAGLFKTLCPQFVKKAVELFEEITCP